MKQVEHIIKALARLITGRPDADRDGLKQHQREAIIDALLYCLHADDFDDRAERSVLDKSIARLNWESGSSIQEYILSASDKVKRAVSSPENEQPFLQDIGHRLEDGETRFQAIQLCKILLYSDLFFSDEEVRALAELRRAFKHPGDVNSIKWVGE